MILVTGATGHVGAELVTLLSARGVALRVMTRRPEAARFAEGIEVVRGDFGDAASLDAAVDGIDAVFAMSAQAVGSAPAPTHDRALAEACARSRSVRRIVKLSVLGGGGDSGPIARWAHEAEGAVRASGIAWTLLRPGRFMSNALGWATMIRAGNDVHVTFATRPAASIDPADVAAVAAAALLEDGHAEKIYELSGPANITPTDEVAVLASVLGRPLVVHPAPVSAARAGMLRLGMSEEVVDAALAMSDTDRGTHVLPTVEQVLGRRARTFHEWATAHADAFR